jgi:hypothetical protein
MSRFLRTYPTLLFLAMFGGLVKTALRRQECNAFGKMKRSFLKATGRTLSTLFKPAESRFRSLICR